MKMLKYVAGSLLVMFLSVHVTCNSEHETAEKTVKIIFDTDHGGDADDLGALVMLHNLHNLGECELLAVMSWSTEQYVIPAIDAVSRYYGNPGIPLGVRSHDTHFMDWQYNKPVADALPWELANADVPLAVDLYRKILAENDDKSITIVTVGPLKNIQDLLMSEPDEHSDLSGKELIERKVKKFVIMGGRFPSGDWEWNFSGNMPGVTRFVLDNLNVPIVFSGFELGAIIHTGPRFHELNPGHPLFVGYMHFSKHASWMQDRYQEGRITPNASFDQTAVLYAVRAGVGKYWDKVENGYCVADDNGGNIWVETDEPTNHAYLVLKKSPEEMAQVIYSLKLTQGIRIWPENPYYFIYQGKPILLLGASDYHNIFQRDNLVSHLDSMLAYGGNYVRNTMASREITDGHRDLWPYKVVETTNDPLISIYDLDQWNEAYWERFSHMLHETHKRDIIVEIELWERHDTYRTRDQAGWLRHPYNPDNNINFTQSESFLPAGEWTMTGLFQGHPFFTTVPLLRDNRLVLAYQKAYIDKILSYIRYYDHILYNMNNETQEHHYFGEYWARYIRAWADSLGKHVELTDMQDNHDVTQAPVGRVIDSDLYSFVDISQNNFQKGDIHWERIAFIGDYMKESPMPITNIKVYGTDTAPPPVDYWGDTDEAVARFWRNIIGGCASARFHRPPWGIGLNEVARASLKSARMMTDSMDFFKHVPANHLLSERKPNEAYGMAYEGKEYMVYFPASGTVTLRATEGNYVARWLDIGNATWHEAENLPMPGILHTPGDGHWAVLLKRQ